MQSSEERVKLTVVNGWLYCPCCNRNRKLLKIQPDTQAQHLTVFCRICKNEIQVDVDSGECSRSYGP